MVEESSIIVCVLFASECSSTFELMYAPPAKAMSIGIGAQHTVAGKEWAGEHKKQGAGGCYECAIGQLELSHSQAPISVSYRSPSCLVLGSAPDGPFAVSQHVV